MYLFLTLSTFAPLAFISFFLCFSIKQIHLYRNIAIKQIDLKSFLEFNMFVCIQRKSSSNDTDCEYLLHTENGEQFKYRNYYDSYFLPLMTNLGLEQTPHCCRHTCISMLAEAKVDQTTIKKIVGLSGAMTLTEKIYTHLDIEELVNAINKI